MESCEVHWLGQVDYRQAWELQDRLAAEIAAGSRPPTLLLLEHPHTYTFGRSGHAENLLWSEVEQQERGIQTFWVDRGGDVTYHGPGQLVGYPLLPLGAPLPPAAGEGPRLPSADYIGYLRKLEAALIEALAEFGVQGGRLPGLTGVWVGQAKIAAIGVKVDSRGISRHGFALNVAPQMEYWQGIVGCGLAGYTVTSLAEILGAAPQMAEVCQAVVSAFGNIFEVKTVNPAMPLKFV